LRVIAGCLAQKYRGAHRRPRWLGSNAHLRQVETLSLQRGWAAGLGLVLRPGRRWSYAGTHDAPVRYPHRRVGSQHPPGGLRALPKSRWRGTVSPALRAWAWSGI